MYYMFVQHHWKPSDYYNLGFGEKIIVRAFASRESADIKEQINDINRR